MNKEFEILRLLNRVRPDPKCELEYSTPFELLVAVILSAQCTDIRVNKCTKELFAKYNTPEAFAKADINELQKYIYICGFFRLKAKSIIEISKELISKYNSDLPKTLDELVKLPRVGRKTAAVVLSEAFNIPAIAVDTHVFRVSKRIGLVSGKNVDEVERELMQIYPKEAWHNLHLQLILHGRYICMAKAPRCSICVIRRLCMFNNNKKSKE
jgi:endonuclease-3